MNHIAEPEDVAALKARLAAAEAALAERDAALVELTEANRRLEQMIDALRREKFGPRSEKLSPDQWNLPLEGEPSRRHRFKADGERDRAGHPGGGVRQKADATREASRPEGERVKRNRKPLPPGLPEIERVIERVIEPASTLCPCGCGQMTRIGEGEPSSRHRFKADGERAAARRDPRAVPGAGDAAAEMRLPPHARARWCRPMRVGSTSSPRSSGCW